MSNFTKVHSFQTAPRLGWQVLLLERCDTRGSPIWQGADSTRGGGQGGFFLTGRASPAPGGFARPEKCDTSLGRGLNQKWWGCKGEVVWWATSRGQNRVVLQGECLKKSPCCGLPTPPYLSEENLEMGRGKCAVTVGPVRAGKWGMGIA